MDGQRPGDVRPSQGATEVKLFPRLPNRFAQELFAEQGNRAAEELVGATSHSLMVWPATGADRVTESELSAMRSRALAVAKAHGYPSPLAHGEHTTVDIDLARVLWESAELSPAEAGFGDVWSFIALVLLPDVVLWRAAGSTNVERFVASDLTRHTLARLWWRAHLFTWGLENPEDGWSLWRSSDIGEAELDQIQTRRAGYGRSPKAFRSLVSVYPTVLALADERGLNRRTFWRQAYLRWILRLGAFTDFSGLPEHELLDDLLGVVKEVGAIAAEAPQAEDVRANNGLGESEEPNTRFDGLPLESIVVRLTEAVRAAGEVSKEDLCSAFERGSGVAVPPDRADIVSGIAWQGQALKYLTPEKNGGQLIWRPGSVLPADDRRWGAWSIDSFADHVRGRSGEDDLLSLCSDLFTGRAGQTVKRVARAAISKADGGS
jgi:hypothetical protein